MELSTEKTLSECVITDDYVLTTKDGEPVKLSENHVKNLIKLSLPIEDNRIVVVTSNKERFLCDDYTFMGLYDDVYTDGSICESSLGKVLVDYTFGIILQRGFMDNLIRGVFIVLRGSDKEKLIDNYSDRLLKYLRPEVFSILI